MVAYKKRQQKEVNEAIRTLREIYHLTGRNDLQWFLGIEVIRDRRKRLAWLSQSDYIDKLANLVFKKDGLL